MLEYFLITIIFIAIAILALSIRMLLKKGAGFPDTHVSENRSMRQKGVHCYKTQDKVERIKAAVIHPGESYVEEEVNYGCSCGQSGETGCSL